MMGESVQEADEFGPTTDIPCTVQWLKAVAKTAGWTTWTGAVESCRERTRSFNSFAVQNWLEMPLAVYPFAPSHISKLSTGSDVGSKYVIL